jgi:N-acetylmuramoyl-L-alanine amidase CwlA
MTTVGFADRTALFPLIQPNELPGPVNRTGDKLTASRSFTVHETANENAGATAEMHHRYWSPGGGGRFETSAHVVADALESIQLIPTDEQAWHAGDVLGNTTSVGGEICVNDRAGYPIACRRMAKFIARWLHEVGLQPIDGVTIRKHGSWPGTTHKQCPAHLNAGDWGVTWADFIAMVVQSSRCSTWSTTARCGATLPTTIGSRTSVSSSSGDVLPRCSALQPQTSTLIAQAVSRGISSGGMSAMIPKRKSAFHISPVLSAAA